MEITFHTQAVPTNGGYIGQVVARHNHSHHQKKVMGVYDSPGVETVFPNQGAAIEAAFDVFCRVFVAMHQGIGKEPS